MDIKVTLFTPTYNRGYIIERLYRSLQRQSVKNFEWLVVDDGSSDHTEQLFNQWIKEENAFDIRYYKTINRGKHRAVNYGLDLAKGEFFMVVDSDDYLTDDALEKLCIWLTELDKDSLIMGVVANKGYSESETPNNFFGALWIDKTLLEMNSYEENGKKVLSGERALCFRTDFHRRYKYPEFDGEKFVTEAVVYNRMANDGYKMRFYNDIIWIYEYQKDGLTYSGNKLYLNNPRGYGLWVREYYEFNGINFIQRFAMYYSFTCDLVDFYNMKTIAECIGTKTITIVFISIIHKLVRYVKNIRGLLKKLD